MSGTRTHVSKQAVLDAAARNPHDVRAGQVWRDNDPRSNRMVKVFYLDGPYACVYEVDQRGNLMPGEQRRMDRRKPRRIRLDRFRPTSNGYALHSK
ncbi:hypothetical protein IHN63_00335 [Deinococcus sp. 6YEL10]|uniref:hypothetical protein n=1 Tax=Deinococcus sp. 6YEL10 TaxID=2745870 RepID=UPI001E372FEF|nr:hypothetical protein [Deinococcus sp. 6YEL10]MCD0159746.1 hypothetical protein [Deinococcus sp. 6YEL10]